MSKVRRKSHAKRAPKARKRTLSHALLAGTHVIWPAGLEQILGISLPTRWRWERDGKLPPRDVSIAGRTGWKRATIENALKTANVTRETIKSALEAADGFRTPRPASLMAHATTDHMPPEVAPHVDEHGRPRR